MIGRHNRTTARNRPRQPYYFEPPRRPSHKKSSKRFITISLFIAVIGLVAGHDLVFGAHAKAISTRDLRTATTTSNGTNLSALNDDIEGIIQDNPNITFGVSIKNLNNGSQLNVGSTAPMTAASVSKVLTAADYLRQVEAGNQPMDGTLDDGNTASLDLKQMITVSDDNAWAALNDQLGAGQLQTFASQLGITSYNYANNTLSASDTTNMLSSLYQGKLLNSSDTKLLLTYMKDANYREFIIPAVPKGDTVYHKVGEYQDNVNDAAIITNGKQTVVLSIFTNGNGAYDWTNRASIMQQITKATLSYYHLS